MEDDVHMPSAESLEGNPTGNEFEVLARSLQAENKSSALAIQFETLAQMDATLDTLDPWTDEHAALLVERDTLVGAIKQNPEAVAEIQRAFAMNNLWNSPVQTKLDTLGIFISNLN